jgi:hypothetical protein
MLQQHLHLYTSQPLIYFGSDTPSEEEDLETFVNPSIIHFGIDSPFPTYENTGLFFHWYDLSD